MAFWQVILFFGALGAFFVLWPLIKSTWSKSSLDESIDNDQTQVELYNEHLADLEVSLQSGDIDTQQFEELKTELQKNLIADGLSANKEKVHSGGKKIILACALFVPVMSFILYQQWGAEKDWDIYQRIESLGEAKDQAEYKSKMRELVVEVQQRLNQKPDELPLRNLLGQTSMALQDYDQAVKAYEEILKVYPESPMVMSSLAQALFYREGNVVTDKVREYTHKALALAPMLPEMLGLAGIDAKNRGDFRSAIGYWKRAVASMDPNSASAKGYMNGIANAEKALLDAGESLDEVKNVAGLHAQADQSAPDTTDSTKASIAVEVRLGGGVKLSGDETLFVYARAWQGAKMPLAIKKFAVKDLPVSIILDETMAMAPGMTITSFPTLEVVARISRSGGPIAQPGDWQASVGPIVLGELDGAVNLEISKQLP